jgi:hypothetical protein
MSFSSQLSASQYPNCSEVIIRERKTLAPGSLDIINWSECIRSACFLPFRIQRLPLCSSLSDPEAFALLIPPQRLSPFRLPPFSYDAIVTMVTVVALPIVLADTAPCRTWRREMEKETNGSDVNHCLQHSRTKVCNILKPHVTLKNMLQLLKLTVVTLKKYVATSRIVCCNINKNKLRHLKLTIATSRKTCCNI